MPRYDANHFIVRRALAKEGWNVTHDQWTIKHKGLRVYIDLIAEKRLRADNRIAVEIKVFGGHSETDDFEKAVGQYSLYRDILESIESGRELFLAITQRTHAGFFQIPLVREYVVKHQIHLLVFDDEREEVVEWIKQKK